MTHERARVRRRAPWGTALLVAALSTAAGLGLAMLVGPGLLAALPGSAGSAAAAHAPTGGVSAAPRGAPSVPSRSAERGDPDPEDAADPSVSPSVAAAWQEQGGAGGWLGEAASDPVCSAGRCTQEFAGGWVVDGPDGDAFPVEPSPYEEWQRLRGADGFLGLPLSAARCTDGSTSRSCEQRFQGATLGWRDDAAGDGPGRATVLDVDDPMSLVVVVNKQRPMQPSTFEPPELTGVGGAFQLRPEAAAAFDELRDAAEEAGAPVRASSGYRSYDEQRITYDRWVSQLGRARADELSARAGHSEHQTGLAVDLHAVGTSCQRYQCFGDTDAGEWVAKHAHEFGFLIRFRAGEEDVTGYDAEPWHLRYVGKALARDMRALEARTLEEHLGLPAAPTY